MSIEYDRVDALKDCVDHVINVEKEEGYAKVNV